MVLQGKTNKTKTSKFSYLSEPFEALELGRKECRMKGGKII